MNELQVGDLLDHYRIDGLAAQSGMACIYRATDTRNGQAVAIKVPHFEVESDPLCYDRFKREEEIGKKLAHPGVVKVFEREDPSRLYMVMEWIEGRILRHILAEEKRLSSERAIRITLEICEALNYIHTQGMVHRDLKPENVMVDCEDRVKLIDFGIASSARARRLTFGKLTHTLGTADYVSPEQVKSNRSAARGDIYSAGVMLYEMLTGQVPFQGPTPLAVMNDRLVNDPIPPREWNPEISVQLQEIIYRALEREPENRYPNALAFAGDLRSPESVTVTERRNLRGAKIRRTLRPQTVVFYTALAMIPVVAVLLLLIAARGH